MGCDLPHYPLWVGDFEMDTAYMTAEQVGAYVRLLNHAWKKEGVPDDMAQLALIARVPARRFTATVWPAVSEHWTERGGKLINRRQEKVRAEALARHRARVKAGAAGGRAKAEASAC